MNTPGYGNQNLNVLMHRFGLRRGFAFGTMIIAALLAFEIFNYSTTEFALTDLLGDLEFASLRWATILAIAFCGIDFAGIARLFTPEDGADEPSEVWYLFGAWLLAATMNAMLTWWGVSIAILNNETLGNAVVGRETLLKAVPIFVAVMVWLIRVLIIGTFSVAGDRLFSQAESRAGQGQVAGSRSVRSLGGRPAPAPNPVRPAHSVMPSAAMPRRPAPKPVASQAESGYSRPEPTYHPVSMGSHSDGNGSAKRSPFQPRR
jgi:hypothetical protein